MRAFQPCRTTQDTTGTVWHGYLKGGKQIGYPNGNPKQPAAVPARKGLVDVGFTRLQPQDLQQMEHSGMGAGTAIWDQPCSQLSDAVIEEIAEAPTHTYFHHYRTINAFLDQMVLQTGFWLEQHGYVIFQSPRRKASTCRDGSTGDGFPTNNLPVWQAWEP